jgi:hypothetical protein
MHFICITDDAEPDDIREAIGHLRAKRRACQVETIRLEIDEDVDELLDLLSERACN